MQYLVKTRGKKKEMRQDAPSPKGITVRYLVKVQGRDWKTARVHLVMEEQTNALCAAKETIHAAHWRIVPEIPVTETQNICDLCRIRLEKRKRVVEKTVAEISAEIKIEAEKEKLRAWEAGEAAT